MQFTHSAKITGFLFVDSITITESAKLIMNRGNGQFPSGQGKPTHGGHIQGVNGGGGGEQTDLGCNCGQCQHEWIYGRVMIRG